jgi:hypothetical protein
MLTLTGAGPAGTIYLNGSSLPSAYLSNPIDAYTGVLDWQNTSQGNAAVYTYCIDVAAIININNTYSLNPVALDTAHSGFSQTVSNAIQYLWNDSTFGNAGKINSTMDVASISVEHAAMFQVALWDIIYNAGSASPSNTALTFSNPGAKAIPASNGFSSADLSTALTAAHNDYVLGQNGAPTNAPQLMELDATDGSQNQVIYLGAAPAAALPLPSAVWGDALLLGGLLFVSRRHNRAQVG